MLGYSVFLIFNFYTMKFAWIFLSLFWIVIILYPQFLAYLIGWFFLFLGLNIILFNFKLGNMKNKWNTDDRWSFFKIWKYKIYK